MDLPQSRCADAWFFILRAFLWYNQPVVQSVLMMCGQLIGIGFVVFVFAIMTLGALLFRPNSHVVVVFPGVDADKRSSDNSVPSPVAISSSQFIAESGFVGVISGRHGEDFAQRAVRVLLDDLFSKMPVVAKSNICGLRQIARMLEWNSYRTASDSVYAFLSVFATCPWQHQDLLSSLVIGW